jgi:hypothetical protein
MKASKPISAKRDHKEMGRRMVGIELAFVRSVGEALNAAGKDYRGLSVRLRGLKRLYTQRFNGNQRSIREVERRIAELLLQQSIRHGCSFKVCRARMNNLRKLGFSNMETKSTYYLLYAKGAMDRGHHNVARRAATRMAEELEHSLRRRKSLAGEKDLQLLKLFLTKLDHAA